VSRGGRWEGEGLRAVFAELRQVEEAGAPGLDRLLARGRAEDGMMRRAHPLRLAGAVAVLLAAALGVWLGDAGGGRSRSPGATAAALADWVAPTDFLLDTPGIELLRSTPEIPGPLLVTNDGSTLPLATGDAR
jgi:hypothetical protein